MARTIFKLNYSNFEISENKIKEILYNNDFKETIINSETVWKKGGMIMGGQCLIIEFSENQITISAWITPFLGGTDEYALDGFSAIIPKKQLLSIIEQIKIAIQ